ncbi:MAG: 50S ribosomal protein L35 [Candidatus Moraniibacteriota bacterium]
MPKQKTNKAVSKKVKVTGSGKLMRRTTGHNHYNSHETGAVTRSKRRDLGFFPADGKNIQDALNI